MPNEIRFIIIGETDQGYKELMEDPDMIHHVAAQYGTIDFDRSTDIHDYIRDRFDGINQCLNPNKLGLLSEVLKTLRSDLEELKKGVPFEDLMDVTWLNRSVDYQPILLGIESAIEMLEVFNDDHTQQIILYWW